MYLLTVLTFFPGELKENLKLVLCFIPRPIPAMLSCLFGRQTYLKSCTSWFNVILLILLFPLLAIVALMAICLLVGMMLIFLPFFLVFLLPCIIVKKCREKIDIKKYGLEGDLEMNHIDQALM